MSKKAWLIWETHDKNPEQDTEICVVMSETEPTRETMLKVYGTVTLPHSHSMETWNAQMQRVREGKGVRLTATPIQVF